MAARRACGFVVFRRFSGDVEYLLMQTSYGLHHWTPPKGHVKSGETDMMTALRETEEEAGFTSDDLKVFESAKREQVYNVNNKPKTVVYWLAELMERNKDARLSSEHQEFRWLKLQEACELAGYEEMKNTLKYFDEYIIENKL